MIRSIVQVLPCQHFYHVECIDPWIEFQSGSCPLCKQDAIAIGKILLSANAITTIN